MHRTFALPVVSSISYIFLTCRLNSPFQVLYQNSTHLKPLGIKKPLAIIENYRHYANKLFGGWLVYGYEGRMHVRKERAGVYSPMHELLNRRKHFVMSLQCLLSKRTRYCDRYGLCFSFVINI